MKRYLTLAGWKWLEIKAEKFFASKSDPTREELEDLKSEIWRELLLNDFGEAHPSRGGVEPAQKLTQHTVTRYFQMPDGNAVRHITVIDWTYVLTLAMKLGDWKFIGWYLEDFDGPVSTELKKYLGQFLKGKKRFANRPPSVLLLMRNYMMAGDVIAIRDLGYSQEKSLAAVAERYRVSTDTVDDAVKNPHSDFPPIPPPEKIVPPRPAGE